MDPRHLYLYGTIHVGRVGGEPFNLPLVAALQASCRLALEADLRDESAVLAQMQQAGIYPAGDGLEQHLPAALMARVVRHAARHGPSVEQLDHLRPWLLANLISSDTFTQAGLDPALGSEKYLTTFAVEHGLPIIEIEGLAFQMRLFAGEPEALQAAQLDEVLDGVDTPQAKKENRDLFALWLHGDAAAATRFVARTHREAVGKPFARYAIETLIDARNRTMADRAMVELARDGTTFFAVGALHLFGPTGLIAELRRRGNRVVDLQAATLPAKPGDGHCPPR